MKGNVKHCVLTTLGSASVLINLSLLILVFERSSRTIALHYTGYREI